VFRVIGDNFVGERRVFARCWNKGGKRSSRKSSCNRHKGLRGIPASARYRFECRRRIRAKDDPKYRLRRNWVMIQIVGL